DAPTPLARVARLFQNYQAPIYGALRTPVLQRIYERLAPLSETLSRELLWSALTAVEGSIVRLPVFNYGRNHRRSGSLAHWHPLEWIWKDGDGLFGEYERYRGLLTAAVLEKPDNIYSADEIGSTLDLVHLRYLLKHAPAPVLAFVAEQEMSSVPFADYWPHPE